ncbi:ABC transporter permease subunit [Bifidobacterium sp. SMB2]|uniref:ABC transporter permease subunit n=1 Tax=Bifidobacterium saimiriisciurei TaxID=2661627 RepID=A0ABX0C9S0_9BIFI|nr:MULTISPECIES: amino acid ABC transporter permease [Bifidobacterium]NEG96722.1 ABC transporter permease subunit [Bifidobacterium sp. SMB2]NEH11878.1 ABC transporter permease subunit [Bifidobacterium saimiriisciurei]
MVTKEPLLQFWGEGLPNMLHGLQISAALAGVSMLIGLPLGLLFCMMVMSRNRVVSAIGLVIVEIGRGMPALIILYLVYFGLPGFGILLESFPSAIIALAWNYSCYCSEIFRAGIQAVPGGQNEAGDALGLDGRVTFFYVILPQAFRSIIPALLGQTILLFQDTSLAYTVAVPELMKEAYTYGSTTFQYLRVFVLAGLCYAVVTLPASWITRWLERRLALSY